MRAHTLSLVATLLACGCAVAAPKSRLEPEERVAVQIRSGTTDLHDARGEDAFEQAVRNAIGQVASPVGDGSDVAAALNAALGPLVDDREFQSRFAAVVSTELARRRTLAATPQRADAILAVRLHSLEVRKDGGDEVSLRITTAARIESGGEEAGRARTAWHADEYESPARPYREWIDSDGRALLEDVETAFDRIADDVIGHALRTGERPGIRD